MTGEVQLLQPAPSRLHSNVAEPSSAENDSWAYDADVVPDGPPSTDVCGAVASTVNERVAGV